jgi:hypothetical protein
MSDISDMVKLKNGSEEPLETVTTASLTISEIAQSGIVGLLAIYDIRKKVEDPNYQISDASVKKLVALGLLESSGIIHDSVRNIVLSSIEIKGTKVTIKSPIAGM